MTTLLMLIALTAGLLIGTVRGQHIIKTAFRNYYIDNCDMYLSDANEFVRKIIRYF